jgi:hypothetical protein
MSRLRLTNTNYHNILKTFFLDNLRFANDLIFIEVIHKSPVPVEIEFTQNLRSKETQRTPVNRLLGSLCVHR